MSHGEQGLQCRKCGCRHLPVVYTRHIGTRIKRVRECRNCLERYSTYEQIFVEPSSKSTDVYSEPDEPVDTEF